MTSAGINRARIDADARRLELLLVNQGVPTKQAGQAFEAITTTLGPEVVGQLAGLLKAKPTSPKSGIFGSVADYTRRLAASGVSAVDVAGMALKIAAMDPAEAGQVWKEIIGPLVQAGVHTDPRS